MPSAFLLDLDGTLYTQAGAIPGAPELVRAFRAKGVPFRLVTNTSSRPRRLLVERHRSYGFEVEAADIQTPIFTAVKLLTERGHRRIAPFLPVGSLEDLTGLELAGGVAPSTEGGTPPTAVLVGDLGERWTYALLQEAFSLVMAGAELMALSRDRFWQRADGLALDAGPFVAALEYATTRSATVAGKPSPEFFHAAAAGLPRPTDAASVEVVMVGDDLWSDVQGAQRAGYRGWLVRTGKFREDQLGSSGVRPDRVLNSLADLL
jgi:HAD superfamily hydrolase (TIGR01458 family)